MTGIVLAPDLDFPNEGDSHEFESEAHKLVQLHDGTVAPFDNEDLNLGNRANEVIRALAAVPAHSLSWVSFCCHGWSRGIQAGFDQRGYKGAHMPSELAAAIARVADPTMQLIVPLYACSTAELNPAGFAATLSLALSAAGCQHKLTAHTSVGHCTRDADVRVYPGGDWLIAPGTPHRHAFVNALHDLHNDLRLRYPWMSREDVIAELTKK